MVLALAIHTVSAVTAKVPFSMMALMDHVRKRDLPPELKCRQVFPTNGLRSTSLWDVSDIEVLQTWLDEYLEVDCTNEVFQVQEDFAYGISAELTRMRTAEKVNLNARATAQAVSDRTKLATAAATQQMSELDAKYKVSENTAAALKVAKESGKVAASKAGAVLGRVSQNVGQLTKTGYSKAMENEHVASAATVVGTSLTATWGKMREGFGYLRTGSGMNGGSPTTETGAEADGVEGHFAGARPSADTSPVVTNGAGAPKTVSDTLKGLAKSGNTGSAESHGAATSARPASGGAVPSTSTTAATSGPPASPAPTPAPAPVHAPKNSSDMFTLDDLDDFDEEPAPAHAPAPAAAPAVAEPAK